MTDAKTVSNLNHRLVFKMAPGAIAPKKASKFDAGYDLSTPIAVVIPARKRELVKTGITVAIPYGYYGRVAPRSGLALKQGIAVMAGVVDYGYRGEIGVILYNTTGKDVKFAAGDRIAQFVLEKIYEGDATYASEKEDLPPPTAVAEDGARGTGGFGSTGK